METAKAWPRSVPKPPGAVLALTDVLADENPAVRENSALALGRVGPAAKTAVPALIKALKDEHDSVGSRAAGALGLLGREAKAAVPALIENSRRGPGQEAGSVVDQVRLFPNHPEIRWEHRVHEQILASLGGLGVTVQQTDVVTEHDGYQDAAVRRAKAPPGRCWRRRSHGRPKPSCRASS